MSDERGGRGQANNRGRGGRTAGPGIRGEYGGRGDTPSRAASDSAERRGGPGGSAGRRAHLGGGRTRPVEGRSDARERTGPGGGRSGAVGRTRHNDGRMHPSGRSERGDKRLRAGTAPTLRVDREVPPNGYFLTDGLEDVLLPYSEKTREIGIGEEIEVFLYHDAEDRLTATMKQPLIREGELALLEVAAVHPKLGAFLEMGLGRQLLLPRTELPELEQLHPQPGDRVYVKLSRDKQGRMLALPAKEEDFRRLAVPAPASWHNTTVPARVYKPLQVGTFVLCDAGVLGFGVLGFVHRDERPRLLRLGEAIEARVAFVREDGSVNLSMRPRKEIGRDEDAERILAFLAARPGGAMPYSDQTPADIVKAKFGISKAAFKRAMGKLLKERRVVQEGNWTKLAVPAAGVEGDASPERPPEAGDHPAGSDPAASGMQAGTAKPGSTS